MERTSADKQHRELISAIRRLTPINQDDAIATVIDKNSQAINVFLSKIEELQKTEIKIPDVIVNTNQDEVVAHFATLLSATQAIIDGQKEIIGLLNKKPSMIKIVRDDSDGRIDFVNIIYNT